MPVAAGEPEPEAELEPEPEAELEPSTDAHPASPKARPVGGGDFYII